ncbi:MAG TPA: glycine cleavage system aminomethyltransferase GcvT [Chthonomonadales bacterium]|nr:glycine cleavage system aminomethyltransferase GcvT [Chthonomonadales bacterium]
MGAAEAVRRTPLHARHVDLNARMTSFAGWDMPVQYAGVLPEARAVRSACGVFDISHMGRLKVSGPGAIELLDKATTNDVRGLEPGRAHYTLLTNHDGGIIDDLIIYRLAGDSFLLVVNAANTTRDLAWLKAHARAEVRISDITPDTAMVAVQGPLAVDLTERATDAALSGVERFAFYRRPDADTIWCRTGYTGEDGFEVLAPADAAEQLWRALLEHGATPCGLGARDTLRAEAGYPLYGHEIDETTTPVEAGLMWVVRLEKGPFHGRDRITAAKESAPERRLVGIVGSGRVVPRQGYTLATGDEPVGIVTSGVFSPVRERGCGMAYVARRHARAGSVLSMHVRADRHRVTVVARKDLLPRS